jgi:hypothetical protein
VGGILARLPRVVGCRQLDATTVVNCMTTGHRLASVPRHEQADGQRCRAVVCDQTADMFFAAGRRSLPAQGDSTASCGMSRLDVDQFARPGRPAPSRAKAAHLASARPGSSPSSRSGHAATRAEGHRECSSGCVPIQAGFGRSSIASGEAGTGCQRAKYPANLPAASWSDVAHRAGGDAARPSQGIASCCRTQAVFGAVARRCRSAVMF